jgi:hypothetical protein
VERRYSSYLFSTSALDGGEWSDSPPGRALPPGLRTPGTHCTGGWVGPIAGLDTEARGIPFASIEPRSPGRPARSQTLYWLSYPADFKELIKWLNMLTVIQMKCSKMRAAIYSHSTFVATTSAGCELIFQLVAQDSVFVFKNSTVSWDIAPCRLVKLSTSHRCILPPIIRATSAFYLYYCHDIGGSKCLWKVRVLLQGYAAPYPSRLAAARTWNKSYLWKVTVIKRWPAWTPFPAPLVPFHRSTSSVDISFLWGDCHKEAADVRRVRLPGWRCPALNHSFTLHFIFGEGEPRVSLNCQQILCWITLRSNIILT